MRRLAVAILIGGLCVSAAVYVVAPQEDADSNTGLLVSTNNLKRYKLELERMGGKAAVMAAELNEWFDSLWHGRQLAATLAVLSMVASAACFAASSMIPKGED